MDESTIRGMKSLELEDRESNRDDESSRLIRICVEGYDPSLCGEKLKCVLRKHFWSCGTLAIIRVCTINRCFVTFLGERDTEKMALERDGSDMKGWNIVVTPFPYPKRIPELDAYKEASKTCTKAEEDEREGGWCKLVAKEFPRRETTGGYSFQGPCGPVAKKAKV